MVGKLSSIFSGGSNVNWYRYYFQGRFTIGRWTARIIDFLLGLIGYTYLNAGYSYWRETVDVHIFDLTDPVFDLAKVVTESVTRKNKPGYGLIRRLRLNDEGFPYAGRPDGPPVQYWQFGKFLQIPRRDD